MGAKRSTGCNTCRRRRVKCDEDKPACRNCLRTGYLCEGYTRGHRFVDEVSRTIRDARKAHDLSPRFDGPEISPIHASKRDLVIHPNLDLSAFKDNLYTSFLLSNLCLGVIMPTSMIETQAEDTSSPLAQLSMRALSTAYFGRMHKQDQIVKQGIPIYGQALRHLIEELHDPKKVYSLSTLSSSITLQTYEFIGANSTSGWLDHAGGIGRLIELRGLRRLQTRLDREIFEANRVNVVIECSTKNKRCFLEDSEWKNEPWASDPQSKDMTSYLLDILCDLPGLKIDVANLKNPYVDDPVSYGEVSAKIKDRIRQLYILRLKWEAENQNSCTELPAQEHLHEPHVFSSTIWFSNAQQANEILLYNAALIVFSKMILEIGGSDILVDTLVPGSSPVTSQGPLLLPGEAEDISMIGREICKCVDYYLSDCRHRTGFYLFIALTIAYISFPPKSREAEWVEKTMSEVADLNGFGMVKTCGPMWI